MRTWTLAAFPLLFCVACSSEPSGSPLTGTVATTDGPSNDSGEGPVGGTSPDNPPPTTGGTEGADSDTMDDGGFVPDADVGGPIVMCDPFAQDCPESQKCVPFIPQGENAWLGSRCVEVTGAAVDGDPCLLENLQEPNDGCDQDHLCWELIYNEDGNLEGVCRPFCSGSAAAPECAESAECLLTGTINVCLEPCHPLLDDCGEAKGCYISPGQDHFVCQPISGGYEEGAPCVFINDCNPGLFCAADSSLPDCLSETGGCCTSHCDAEGEDTCVAPTTCVNFFEPSPPSYTDLGLCILPE